MFFCVFCLFRSRFRLDRPAARGARPFVHNSFMFRLVFIQKSVLYYSMPILILSLEAGK